MNILITSVCSPISLAVFMAFFFSLVHFHAVSENNCCSFVYQVQFGEKSTSQRELSKITLVSFLLAYLSVLIVSILLIHIFLKGLPQAARCENPDSNRASLLSFFVFSMETIQLVFLVSFMTSEHFQS